MSWLHVLTLAAAASVSAAAPETPAPVDPSTADSIALKTERHERVTVPVTIKGQGPFRFMVDTGAQATVVSTALAERLGLTVRRPGVLVGMASRKAIETTEIPEFGLGSRTFHIQVAPLVLAENLGGDIDGILGLDSLQNQRVLIDFRKRSILVDDAKHLGGNAGYEIVVKARRKLGQLIITGARINGIEIDVIVDTGSQISVGNLALLDRLRRARAFGKGTMTDVNGNDLTAVVRLARTLEIDRMSLNQIPILFADAPPFAALGMADKPALILGMRELSLFQRVAIDFATRRVLFDLPPEETFSTGTILEH
jgi:predicted aspartyl protease